MGKRILAGLIVLIALALAALHVIGNGTFMAEQHAGEPKAKAVAPAVVAAREAAQARAASAAGMAGAKQILFGDLHVHTTFSFDAFQMSLPMAGGDGAYPVSDACDYARHCAGLDFWSINDHGISLTPRRWRETVEAIRRCNEVSGGVGDPDMVSFLGWEWTQVGTNPTNHYGHKNVILRDLEDGKIPTRPIAAGTPPGMPSVSEAAPPAVLMGLLAVADTGGGGFELARYMTEMIEPKDCPIGVAVRDLPDDCREVAPTPADLFAKLDEWGVATTVIPHGTTWGFYTSLGSAWDKQLTPKQHDPNRQRLIEVFSGHGNSEEFRPYREVLFDADGKPSCPPPHENYLPSCWRAGEIIAKRCLDSAVTAEECAARAAAARRHFVEADFNGGFASVPATTIADWQDAGQCRDCFQPAFNYRPRSSVQYMMALGRPDNSNDTDRFRFGFIASSDNHSGRPGTGYKEVARTEFTETRFGNFAGSPLAPADSRAPAAKSEAIELVSISSPFQNFETERQASFFLTGGLAAVHTAGRNRAAVWDALQRREVYGTSGPRILLWFDLLNAPGGQVPMGGSARLATNPEFRVRAVGSFEQKPGCPTDASQAMSDGQIERLCRGECYNPSDTRRPITRIEIVRIRPQQSNIEDVATLIDDPWRVYICSGAAEGCDVTFRDDDYAPSGRDTLYYARAIEAPSLAVDADPLGCERNQDGRCTSVNPCSQRPLDDDCLSETEERAWSSPIFVDQL